MPNEKSDLMDDVELEYGPVIPFGIARGQVTAILPESVEEADYFIRCQACNGWVDLRDLAWVLDHEGPLPHPALDREQ